MNNPKYMELGEIIRYCCMPGQLSREKRERFTIDLIVVEADGSCSGCHFRSGTGCLKPARFSACTAMGRVDNISVKFIIHTGGVKRRKERTPLCDELIKLSTIAESVAGYQDIPDAILKELEDDDDESEEVSSETAL